MKRDPESFYSNSSKKLSDDIVDDIKRANGIVTKDDLVNYKSRSRKPYKSNLSGMNMYLTPPPTSDAVLALILNILKGGCCSSKFFFSLFYSLSPELEEVINIKHS